MSDKDAVASMQRTVQELEAERLRLQDVVDVWRERAEKAEARLGRITGMQREELARATAEAQREACADAVYDCVGTPLLTEVAGVVRATPLVTEEAP